MTSEEPVVLIPPRLCSLCTLNDDEIKSKVTVQLLALSEDVIQEIVIQASAPGTMPVHYSWAQDTSAAVVPLNLGISLNLPVGSARLIEARVRAINANMQTVTYVGSVMVDVESSESKIEMPVAILP